MKLDRHLPKLPSLSDLLKHPTVKDVVERANQTTIVQRATGLLAEVQASWLKQAEEVVVPSIAQVAQRLADRLAGSREHAMPVVNATGTVLSDRWPAPLAEEAVRELARIGPEYHEPVDAIARRVEASLAACVGAKAARVVESFADATSWLEESDQARIEIAQHAGFINPTEYGLADVPTIAERLHGGAELVVVDGAGLIGGPRCGILIGQQALVEKLCLKPTANVLVLLALEATIGIVRSRQEAMHRIPVLQLLSTPLDNLKQRCERLAQLIAASPIGVEAEPIRCESTWCEVKGAKLRGPSWSVRVRALDDLQGAEIPKRLSEAMPQVVAREESDGVYLDLRSVFPRWDRHLADVLTEPFVR